MSKDVVKDCRSGRTDELIRVMLNTIGEMVAERDQAEKMHDQLIRWYQDLSMERDRLRAELKKCRAVLEYPGTVIF